MIDFTDKVMVMSGANGAITRAIAEAFYERGANLVLSDLDGDGLQEFASALDPSGKRVVATKVDVTDPEEVDASIALCEERFGGADFLITGAGLYRDQLTADMTDAQWRQTIGINLDGAFYYCRAIQRIMRAGGSIVNIASMAAHRGSFQHAHYSAAKGGVLSLTRSIAIELAPRNVRVNAVSPGLIDTPLIQPLLEKQGDMLIQLTPMKRLGQPSEVAKVILFLCSDLASIVPRESISIEGDL